MLTERIARMVIPEIVERPIPVEVEPRGDGGRGTDDGRRAVEVKLEPAAVASVLSGSDGHESEVIREPATPITQLPDHPVTHSTADSVLNQVLSIVAEKTGYPKDMLDPDLDLEADLGIDTVKQAETFAVIRAAFDIPRRGDLKLRDYPTLKHVVGFVREMRPDLAQLATDGRPQAALPPATAQPASAAGRASSDPVMEQVLSIVAEKTGYPRDMLDLDLDMEADLGIDTVKQAETFAAIRAAFDIPRRDDLKLRDYPTLKHVIQFVRDSQPEFAKKAAG